jgi:uncharacterized radical SAM superfamily Fe-S cluster-containing enzyme
MIEQFTQTVSLCPHCFRRIPARRISTNEATYLSKSCPEHGDLGKTLIWKNHPWPYLDWSSTKVNEPDTLPAGFAETAAPDDCPYACGLCPSHKQATCSVILEVTRQCNMCCPFCFASAEPDAVGQPDISQIEKMLLEVIDSAGFSPIQLSGGEPTLRDDLPQIVTLARKLGFDHIQINTNGIRLAEDADYAHALKDAGVSDFFLQFDGITDEVYRYIRGAELLSHKLKALERCAELKLGVIMVPTLVKNINDNQIGSIIRFAKKWIPTVRGVHFQPMTYLGRYPSAPRNEDRILIPDILSAIENQTEGELKIDNFVPPG